MALTAGDVLVRCGVDVGWVRRMLPRVEPFSVPVRCANRPFHATWVRGIVAVATPWAVYLAPDAFHRLTEGSDPRWAATLMVHELTHVEQYRRLGAVRHALSYGGDYLRNRMAGRRHWDAYRNVALEVEARRVAASLDDEGDAP